MTGGYWETNRRHPRQGLWRSRKVSRMTTPRKDILDGPGIAELVDAWKYMNRRGFTVKFSTGHVTGPLDWNSDPGHTEVSILGLRHLLNEKDRVWFEARLVNSGRTIQGYYNPQTRRGYFE